MYFIKLSLFLDPEPVGQDTSAPPTSISQVNLAIESSIPQRGPSEHSTTRLWTPLGISWLAWVGLSMTAGCCVAVMKTSTLFLGFICGKVDNSIGFVPIFVWSPIKIVPNHNLKTANPLSWTFIPTPQYPKAWAPNSKPPKTTIDKTKKGIVFACTSCCISLTNAQLNKTVELLLTA